MSKEKPLLKITVKGPAIKPGRIPVPLLVTICKEMQNAITREAEAHAGRRSLRRGSVKRTVVSECAIELVSVKKGSLTLSFVPPTDRKALPRVEQRRTEAVDSVAAALKSFSRERGNTSDVPDRILEAFEKLGEVLDRGVDELQLIVPRRNGNKRDIVADLIPAVRSNIKNQRRRNMEAKVLRQTSRSQKANVDPKIRKMNGLGVTDFPQGSDFFAAKSIDDLIAQQGIQPVGDLSAFATLSDQEVDSLIAEIHQGREA